MSRGLRPSQTRVLSDIFSALRVHRRVLVQADTGFGKTVVFANMIQGHPANTRFLVLVHREELLNQAAREILDWAEVRPAKYFPDMPRVNPATRVIVSMVATAYNRLTKKPDFFGERDVVIVDEAHRGEFRKIYDFYPEAKIVGFSATPMSSDKKRPLRMDYETLITGPSTVELIQQGSLTPNRTRINAKAKKEGIKITRGEFNKKQSSEEFRRTYNLEHALNLYKTHMAGQKTLIFNVDVAHSLEMDKLFRSHGIPSKHLDGRTDKMLRKGTLRWFANTPDAVLNNVGVLTTGFDEPSVINIVLNFFTNSLVLFRQVCGRGARLYPGKSVFNIWDLGGNGWLHGDWSDPVDWQKIFRTHGMKKHNAGEGIPPKKLCPSCSSFIPASAKSCQFCGYQYPETDRDYDTEEVEMIDFPSAHEVREIAEHGKRWGRKPFWELFELAERMAARIPKDVPVEKVKEHANAYFQEEVKAWAERHREHYSEGLKRRSNEILERKITGGRNA